MANLSSTLDERFGLTPKHRWTLRMISKKVAAAAVIVLSALIAGELVYRRNQPRVDGVAQEALVTARSLSRGQSSEESRTPVSEAPTNRVTRNEPAFLPLANCPTASVRDAGNDVLDAEFVLGVEINGEARAYPLNMLATPDRHVINDTLGGEPIAVTWCGIYRSPAVFARRVPGRLLTFVTGGKLFRENLIIRDVETGSEWSQLLGDAIAGPLRGERLEMRSATWTDWGTWRVKYPETTALKLSRVSQEYVHDQSYSRSGRERRRFASLQWGMVRGDRVRSWPLAELAWQPLVNEEFAKQSLLILFDTWSSTVTAFDRRLDGKELTFRFERRTALTDDQTGSVWDPVTGQALHGQLKGRRLAPVAGVTSEVRGWRLFHPQSEIWRAERGLP
jgi:hypothetical protein